MRHTRILGDGPICYYHVISRVIERRFILDESERESFRKLMRSQEAFSGVRVVTWTCLSNHFHMLVAVDGRTEERPHCDLQTLMDNDEAFVKRLAHIYDVNAVNDIAEKLATIRESHSKADYKQKEIAKIKQPYLNRMYDLSSFVGEIKQRLSLRYNRRNERLGPLWEDRFKSLLVQGEHGVLSMVAAYIDLNAVRAGIVKEPKDWRWCGYAEAAAAQGKARNGVYEALGMHGDTSGGGGDGHGNSMEHRDGRSWSKVHQRYRTLLMHEAVQKRDEHGRVVRKGITREQFEVERERGFELPSPVLLHQRVRYFVDGLALGTEAFVERVFRKNRRRMGVKRKTGARMPKSEELGGLRTMCDLRGSSAPLAKL